MTAGIDERKQALRADLRERRNALGVSERERLGIHVSERLQAFVLERGAHRVSAYLSTPSEPNVRPFLEWARAHDVTVLLPITREDGLLDWIVDERGEEFIGVYGMPEPDGELLGPMAVCDVDLMIIPAAAVDHDGYRLGWGRGYYDRTLGSMQHAPPVAAVVFDHELLQAVPRDVHDQAVDAIITPERTILLTEKAH
ncbi:MAG TPA: 5-formyltetrahydrofolate cyclo-ligase [Microbacteriaceae bacterium]|nr:5-formyltetrahydrofolate cyclo-ligase [Microbacteriaceae bacterium]